MVADTVVKPRESREHRRSLAIDKVLTGNTRDTGVFRRYVPCLLADFNVVGTGLSDIMSLGIEKLTQLCDSALVTYGINDVVRSLIIDAYLPVWAACSASCRL